jgi:hypothetical protein
MVTRKKLLNEVSRVRSVFVQVRLVSSSSSSSSSTQSPLQKLQLSREEESQLSALSKKE